MKVKGCRDCGAALMGTKVSRCIRCMLQYAKIALAKSGPQNSGSEQVAI